MGEMRILDESGDVRQIWDPANKDETDAARETFNKMKKKGYKAFYVKEKGAKGSLMDEFDADAEKYILTPPIVGG